MNPTILKDDQQAAIDRNWRSNAMLKFVEKRAELLDKLEELERLEIEFKHMDNVTWVTAIDYIEKIEKL